MPDMQHTDYATWKKAFDKYKKYINEESVFIGHSTGSIFSVRYLMDNNLKIQKFIGVVSFNENCPDSPYPEREMRNKTFFADNLSKFKNHAKERICFYSPADKYNFKILDKFATEIGAKKIIIQDAGHFTADTGYDKEFKEIVEFL